MVYESPRSSFLYQLLVPRSSAVAGQVSCGDFLSQYTAGPLWLEAGGEREGKIQSSLPGLLAGSCLAVCLSVRVCEGGGGERKGRETRRVGEKRPEFELQKSPVQGGKLAFRVRSSETALTWNKFLFPTADLG